MSIPYAIALGVLALGLVGCTEDMMNGGEMPGSAGVAPAANVHPQSQPVEYRTPLLLDEGQHGAPGSGLLLATAPGNWSFTDKGHETR